MARKEAKDKRRVAKVKTGRAGRVARQDILQLGAGKGGKKNLYAMDEDDSEDTKDCSNRSTESEEDMQAWCILEESESEQWQEVISRRSRQRAKKTNHASLLSVESSYDLSPKKILEEKDKWVKVRATMDSGDTGHVIPEAMFPHVKIEHKTPSKKFAAANGERAKRTQNKRGCSEVHNVQECECCQTPHFNAKSRPSWEHCCAG